MKHILPTLMLAAFALVAAPNAAADYSPEMAEFANLLNEAAASEGTAVSYDGTNIIMEFPQSFFSEDEAALFAMMDDIQPLAPNIAQTIRQTIGPEGAQLFGSLLSAYNTNLLIRLNLGSDIRELIITPEQFIEE